MRVISPAAAFWKAFRTRPVSSGSSRPDSAVEPTRSTNITVRWRRSASPPPQDDVAAASGISASGLVLNSDALDRLPHVDAVLNYLVPMNEKPRNYAYDPPPGVPQTNTRYEPHEMPIRDIRAVAGDFSLDGAGLRLVEQESAVRDFYDEDELRRVYYPEAERLVAAATGAGRVVVFDHTIRRRLPGVADRTTGAPRQPVPRVHND